MEIKTIPIGDLLPYEKNPRKNAKAIEVVAKSIDEYGFSVPILVDEKNIIIAGHTRLEAAKKLGMKKVPIIRKENLTENQVKAFRIMDNKSAEYANWNNLLLAGEFEFLKSEGFNIDVTGFGDSDVAKFLFNAKKGNITTLRSSYIVPPFSVLDGRHGDWQKRKKEWMGIIQQDSNTREGLLKRSNVLKTINEGVSHFDPVLAEVMYEWFCPKGGIVFDPFSGDVEQIIVAGIKGFKFKGTELRKEQVLVNKKLVDELELTENVELFHTDAVFLDKFVKEESVDFVITSPPYYDLENYSDDEKDLSNMEDEDFEDAYKEIIRKSAQTLKKNRFACFVVGEVRAKNGHYRSFVPKTIKFAEEAGLSYYNEIVLVNMVGTLPLRARKYWDGAKKVGKNHQNVLIFYKGDNPKNYIKEHESKDME